MNPANYRLSKEVLQEMLDHEHDQVAHRGHSIYGTDVQGLSPADMAQKMMDGFFDRLSEPLKKMQVDYLTRAGKNCYKAKHMSDDFTNFE